MPDSTKKKLNRNQLTRLAADQGLGLWQDYTQKPVPYFVCTADDDGLPVPSERLHKTGYTAAQVLSFLEAWEARGQKERRTE